MSQEQDVEQICIKLRKMAVEYPSSTRMGEIAREAEQAVNFWKFRCGLADTELCQERAKRITAELELKRAMSELNDARARLIHIANAATLE